MKQILTVALTALWIVGCSQSVTQRQTEPSLTSEEKKIASAVTAEEDSTIAESTPSISSESPTVDTPEEAESADSASPSSASPTADTAEEAESADSASPSSESSSENTAEDTESADSASAGSESSSVIPPETVELANRAVERVLEIVALIPQLRFSRLSEQSAATDEQSETSATTISEETMPPRQPRPTAEVIRAVENLRGLRGWTIIPLAHFQREDRHVIIAWPALNSAGRLVDATVLGICLEETTQGLEECGRRWVVREKAASRAALVSALGGSDYRTMTTNPGAELDNLGPRVSQLGTNFARAVNQPNRAQVRQAALRFSRLLPVGEVAFDNRVAQLLYMAASYNGRLEHTGTVRNGETARLTFGVYRSFLRIRTIQATAREIGNTGRWRIVSYR